MKKILPTFLLLILCVGVLTMGIYAVAPTRNTVDGTINIVAFNGAPVSLEIIKDGETIQEVTNCKAAQPISFGEIDLPTTLGSWRDCPEVRYSIKIKNEGNSAIGAFFTDRSTILGDGELADGTDDIILSKTFKQNSTTIAEMHLSSYTPISAGDTEEMAISFVLRALPTEAQSYNLGLNLYIEEYVASTDNTKVLYKVAEGTTSFSKGELDFEGKILALPKSVNTISLGDMTNNPLKCLNIPNASTTSFSIYNCSSEMFFVPEKFCNLVYYPDYNYTSMAGTNVFVSIFNDSYSNDNQYALYNADKTELLSLENIYDYVAPASVTSFPDLLSNIGNARTGTFDFSKAQITDMEVLFNGYTYSLDYIVIMPECIKNVSASSFYFCSFGGHSPEITLKFSSSVAPTIEKFYLETNGAMYITYKIEVPTGSLSAYQTAFNVNNAEAVTAGTITFQEV